MAEYILIVKDHEFQYHDLPTDFDLKAAREKFFSLESSDSSELRERKWNFLKSCARNEADEIISNLDEMIHDSVISNTLCTHFRTLWNGALKISPIDPYSTYRRWVEKVNKSSLPGWHSGGMETTLEQVTLRYDESPEGYCRNPEEVQSLLEMTPDGPDLDAQFLTPIWRTQIDIVEWNPQETYLKALKRLAKWSEPRKTLRYVAFASVAGGFHLPEKCEIYKTRKGMNDQQQRQVYLNNRAIQNVHIEGIKYRQTIKDVIPHFPLPQEIRDLVIGYLDWDFGLTIEHEFKNSLWDVERYEYYLQHMECERYK